MTHYLPTHLPVGPVPVTGGQSPARVAADQGRQICAVGYPNPAHTGAIFHRLSGGEGAREPLGPGFIQG